MKKLMHSKNWQVTLHGAVLAAVFIVSYGAATLPLFGQNSLYLNTQPANAIGVNRATLNGMVLPGSKPAAAWFEWGTSANYGQMTAATNLPSGGGLTVIRQTLSGLSPDYVYHCRLVASNLSGVAYGADQQFTLGATVVVWGQTGFGQDWVPGDLNNAVAIGGGGYHCVALRNDGTIAAWGGNAHGQTDVPADLTNAVAIAVGQVHNLALLPDGTVRVWGAGTTLGPDWPEGGQSIVPADLSNVVQIAAGTTHSLALKADGTVAAWGSARIYSTFWTDLGQAVVPAGLSNVVAISGGDFHNMALRADGTVVIWGDATYGQAAIPPGLTNVVSIAAGWYHNLALRADHTLAAWGYDGYGAVSGMRAGLGSLAGMAGGGFYSLAFQRDGTALGWGASSAGQADIPAGLLTKAVAMAAGYDFSLALQSSAPIEVSLTLQPLGDQLQLIWLGGTLQSAGDVNGPYTDMTGAVSPLVFVPTETQQFYRVQVQP